MIEITLRWAEESDKEALYKISQNPGYEWPHNPEYFEELLSFKRALIAFEEDKPVGYLLFQVIWGNTPFLSHVYLQENQRGKGLGRKMVGLLETRLRDDAYESLVTSSEAKNKDGIAFCKKLGFEEIGILQMGHGPEVFSIKKL